jgi:hypothetical protein
MLACVQGKSSNNQPNIGFATRISERGSSRLVNTVAWAADELPFVYPCGGRLFRCVGALQPGLRCASVSVALRRDKTARQAITNKNKHMRKMKFILALSAIAAVCAFSAHAQTSTNAGAVTLEGTTTNSVTVNTIPNFFNQAATWATSFDTNKTWSGVTLQFEDGLNQTTGTGAADYVRGQYNIGRWNIAAEGDFFGVGSAFNALEGGVGFALVQKYDFKMEVNALAGGAKADAASALKFKAEPEIKITKLMTVNTYATASLSVPWQQGQKFDGTPAFRAGFGFTF